MGDGGGNKLLGPSSAAGSVPRLQRGPGGGVAHDTPQNPARCCPWVPVGDPRTPPLPNLELQKYRISFSSATGQHDFPVDGSQGRVTARIGLHVYFLNWYVQ